MESIVTLEINNLIKLLKNKNLDDKSYENLEIKLFNLIIKLKRKIQNFDFKKIFGYLFKTPDEGIKK